MNVIFQSSGVLPDGKYLSGQYEWASAQRLGRAVLECVLPSAGVLTLELEVAGIATGVVFTVPAGGIIAPGAAVRRWRQGRVLGVTVAPQAEVRWRAHFSGTDDQAASQVALTVAVTEASTAGALTGPSELWVEYVAAGKGSGLGVLDYDATLERFTARPAASFLGVAVTPDTGSGWTLALGGVAVITGQSGDCGVPSGASFVECGVGSAAGGQGVARLRFWIGERVVGVVSANGVWVAGLREVESGASGELIGPYFTLGTGVRLGIGGIEAAGFTEL